MTSQDQFEAWASEHLPTLYLTKTDQGSYESTATGNFYAVWSARDGEIAQLKATVSDYEMGVEAAKEEIARLKGDVEGLREELEPLGAELEKTELRALKYIHRFNAATDLGRELRVALESIAALADHVPAAKIAHDALEPFRAHAAAKAIAMSKGEQP
ncbi:hypothetical protein [Pseudomonas bohemica]|uniref:hypothetical protein n=1 Tax=Pseudomonas bohemica TaxID=2044872 RepID=UPI000DA60DCB|nr:hypothetical protein [Pseudomonas bohemica]